jgi:GNAT superfamily N-acetyltransferase
LRDGARLSDYLILKNDSLQSARGIDACCIMTLEDSQRPVERFYPSPLPRPWGQAGSIGVSADRRSAGYGSALLDATLKHLRERGVRGGIIDWTHLVSYYERFGFKPHRSYRMLVKQLA